MLPFVGLVPLALFVQSRSGDAEGRRSAIRGGLCFGLVYFGVVFYWILVALVWFTWMATLAYVASVMLLMGVAALVAWLLHRGLHDLRLPLWLVVPIAWTAGEWFRAHWPDSLSFPWLGLGSSLTGYPALAGAAELVGSRGLTLWMAAVNGLVATAVLRARSGARWGRWLGTAVAVAAVPMAWGVWRADHLPLRRVARVAVVQPNVPEHIKLDARAALDSTFASLDRLMPRLRGEDVDLVVLPEVTFPLYVRAPYAAPWLERIRAYAEEGGAPLLFGGVGYTGDLQDRFVPYNSAFLMRPGGLTDFQYDKRYLVPMVERVPFLPPEWLGWLRGFGVYGAGTSWPLARVAGGDFAVLICYESTYPQASRRYRREGADVLLNITNDAWYGREPWYARTTALWQHPAHMVMRAIENRMGVARAANTGISLFVDPAGRVYNRTRLFEADLRVDDVFTTDLVTLYTRVGDLAGNGAALAALLVAVAAIRRSRPPRLDRAGDPG